MLRKERCLRERSGRVQGEPQQDSATYWKGVLVGEGGKETEERKEERSERTTYWARGLRFGAGVDGIRGIVRAELLWAETRARFSSLSEGRARRSGLIWRDSRQ